jgi:hypothetical protein
MKLDLDTSFCLFAFKKAFESIANSSSGTRAAGTIGYNASGQKFFILLLLFILLSFLLQNQLVIFYFMNLIFANV